MNHLAYQTLNRYLDQALEPLEQTAADYHLQECGQCRAELAELKSLFSRLESVTPIPIPMDISGIVRSRIQTEAYPVRLPRWGQGLLLVQFAVTLLLGIVVGPWVWNFFNTGAGLSNQNLSIFSVSYDAFLNQIKEWVAGLARLFGGIEPFKTFESLNPSLLIIAILLLVGLWFGGAKFLIRQLLNDSQEVA